MKSKEVDRYIEEAQPFARPVLRHLRELVHRAVPDVEEAIKWNFPCFVADGTILCNMAGFKEHCSFGFWKGKEMDDPEDILEQDESTAMGNLGRITRVEDLPGDELLISYIRRAREFNRRAPSGKAKKSPSSRKNLEVPEDFREALREHPLAEDAFEKFSYSHRKEYVEWITEAKREETRQRRMDQAIEWLSEGKPRNWKYM